MYNEYHLFPFTQVPAGKRIVIYGAGDVGRMFLSQIEALQYCQVAFFVDRLYRQLNPQCGVPVLSFDDLKKRADYELIVIAARLESSRKEIRESLLVSGIPENKIVCFEGGRIRKDVIVGTTNYYEYSFGLSYAQYGEDILARNVFDVLGIASPRYLDVGAHDPFHMSNTALLYGKGSRGVNVEPDPTLITAFERVRLGDVNVCAGVSAKPSSESSMPYYVLDDGCALNTFSRAVADALVAKEPEVFSIKKVLSVPVYTLNEIVIKFCDGKWPEYLTVDIEGLEDEVMRECNLTDGPILITLEIDRIPDLASFNGMMSSKGYVAYCRTCGNITYLQKKYSDALIPQ